MAWVEKTNLVALGTPGKPWPTMLEQIVQNSGDTVITYELGKIEDGRNPLMLPTARLNAEVFGLLYRNLPVRHWLPALEFLIARANPKQNNRVGNLIGAPGGGKSFLAVLFGRARDPRGPLITDAGGKNLEYLLFQTQFDTEQSRKLTDTIDDLLAADSCNALTLKELEKKFGKHYSQENGRRAVDWAGLAQDGAIEADTIRAALEAIRMYEGLSDKGLGFGFKVVKGPLVIAHEQNRDLVIDELNKCKKGSETPLQIVWQVLNGEIAEHTVSLGSLGEFTFRRGQQSVVIATGNLPKDGEATHLISESFDRRVPAYRVPDFDVEDWQDRITQVAASLPISILHRIATGRMQNIDNANPSAGQKWTLDDPEAFTQLLFELSTLGMDEEQSRHVKDWQMSQLGNWNNLLEASATLAEFYHKWGQLVDPDSDLLKQQQFAELLLEVDNADEPTQKVTPSTMIRHVEQALIIGPEKKLASAGGGFAAIRDWSAPFVPSSIEPDTLEASFGTRWVAEIVNEVYRTSLQVGKKQLYAQLKIAMEEAGMIGRNADLAGLINVDPTLVEGSLAQAKSEQATHAALLRTLYPHMNLSEVDDDLLPIRVVQAALVKTAREGALKPLSSTLTVLRVPNTDINTVQQELFKRVAAANIVKGEAFENASRRLPAASLLDLPTLLSSLALPAIGARNLDALWNTYFTNGAFLHGPAVGMAENRSTDGFAITTVFCQSTAYGRPQYQRLHLLRNGAGKRTVIVGDEVITNDLYNRLKRNKIIYLCHEHAEARSRLKAEIDVLGRAEQENLQQALLMRNAPSGIGSAAKNLVDWLSRPDASVTRLPNFITALPPEKIQEPTPPQSQSNPRDMLSGLLND